MAVETANKFGLQIETGSHHLKDFRMAKSKVITAIGHALIECAFAQDPTSVWKCGFYIFNTLIAPVIMGMAFLDESETLTKHKYRLQEKGFLMNSPLQVCSLGVPARRILCYVDTKRFMLPQTLALSWTCYQQHMPEDEGMAFN
jgi:hypothetical protein